VSSVAQAFSRAGPRDAALKGCATPSGPANIQLKGPPYE
jgi:hypothetical protein